MACESKGQVECWMIQMSNPAQCCCCCSLAIQLTFIVCKLCSGFETTLQQQLCPLCSTAELCTSNCMLCAEQSQLTLQLYLKGKTVVCRVCQINWVTASTCSCCNHHPFCCCNHQPGSCCNHHHALSF